MDRWELQSVARDLETKVEDRNRQGRVDGMARQTHDGKRQIQDRRQNRRRERDER